MKKVMVGNHAVAYGAMLARTEVISAYPITPQTQIMEELSEMVADGRLKARYIKVESEHSAMASCIGASATGARAFTATSSQGLVLMHEVLHWASGGRHPIVMAAVNRALAPGLNIWTDQNDTLAQRDTGWIQLYCENGQEVIDTTIMAFKLAEAVNLPVMVVLDAFYLSHTSEPVDIPDQAMVDKFLPKREARYKLDTDEPHSFGALTKPDAYMEIRLRQQDAMDEARHAFKKVEADWKRLSGRSYGAIESYETKDADMLLVTSGTITSTSRHVVNELRAEGKKVGLVKVKMFRPSPMAEIRKALAGVRKVAVLDRNISPGHGGVFAQEIRSALYELPPDDRPILFGYVLGLGGRDVTPKTIREIVDRTMASKAPERHDLWVGVAS
jgi:pyruvate/2-oxoacid:ferredoxin oxidoreductase alpha subunit